MSDKYLESAMTLGNRRSFVRKSLGAVLASTFAGKLFAQDKHAQLDFPIATTLKGDFTFAAVGDLIVTHPVMNEILRTSPQLLELLKADATFGNFEDTVVDLNTFQGYPEALSGGGWLMSTPQVPGDLKAMGFDLVSHANNHATDWGVAGLLETDRRLREAGLISAGSGASLSAARAPGYYEGKAGRVALVATTAHMTDMEPAQDGAGNIHPRPGVSPLRYDMYVVVPEKQFDQLAAIRDMKSESAADKDKKNVVTLFGTKYLKADPGKDGITQHYDLNEADRKAILRSIRQAKETADFVIASAHVHEPGNGSSAPADFLPGFAHDALDAGADVFVGHGPHRLRGIEMYKGKPIFYSLGDFIYQSHSRETISPQEYETMRDSQEMTPAEIMQKRMMKDFNSPVWYESVVTRSHYRDGRLTGVELHPVELGFDGPLGQRGVPQIASSKTAQRILEKLQKLSEPFGTHIEVHNNVGLIKLG